MWWCWRWILESYFHNNFFTNKSMPLSRQKEYLQGVWSPGFSHVWKAGAGRDYCGLLCYWKICTYFSNCKRAGLWIDRNSCVSESQTETIWETALKHFDKERIFLPACLTLSWSQILPRRHSWTWNRRRNIWYFELLKFGWNLTFPHTGMPRTRADCIC